MRISISLEEVKDIIAKNFGTDVENIDVFLNRKLFIKDKNDEEYELLETHLMFDIEKPIVKQEQIKSNKWSKL